MKSESVKTISIYMFKHAKPKWIFDVSDRTAEKIMSEYKDPGKVLTIDNVPTKSGVMSLHIQKDKIDYVTIE